MANKTELIRAKMERTRESLRQKLDALEDRTLGVVKQTGEAVARSKNYRESTRKRERRELPDNKDENVSKRKKSNKERIR